MGREWVSNQVVLGVILGVTVTHTAWLALDKPTQLEAVDAYLLGKKHALSTNPVGMDLEMTCLSLWVNELPANK